MFTRYRGQNYDKPRPLDGVTESVRITRYRKRTGMFQ